MFTSAGDLWLEASGTGTSVKGDLDGDGVADLSILVSNVTGLTAGDFVL
jgi:hypothetical protein